MLIFATFLIIFRKFCGLKLVINKGSGLSSYPVVNKKGGNIKKKKQIAKGLKILE